MSLRHPVERGEQNTRGAFDHFAQAASHFASSSLFFTLCGASVAVWLGGLLLGAGDRFENAAVGVMGSLTLLTVALLKNAELRAERAMQLKLDAIAAALLDTSDRESVKRSLEDVIQVHDAL